MYIYIYTHPGRGNMQWKHQLCQNLKSNKRNKKLTKIFNKEI